VSRVWLAPKSELITQLFLLLKLLKTSFKSLVEFLMIKKYSKFNISHILGLKITKPPPWNPTHQALPIECVPPIIFSFNSIEFQWQICSIFNNSCTVSASIMKLKNAVHLLIEGFLIRVPMAWWGALWIGRDLNLTNKQKQTNYLS
jgi:hypothetical protein